MIRNFWPLLLFFANLLNKQSSYEMVAITHFDCPSVAQLPVDLKGSSTSSSTSTLILISRFVIETDNCALLHRISSHGNQRTFFIMRSSLFVMTSCSFLTGAVIQGTDKTVASIKLKSKKKKAHCLDRLKGQRRRQIEPFATILKDSDIFWITINHII